MRALVSSGLMLSDTFVKADTLAYVKPEYFRVGVRREGMHVYPCLRGFNWVFCTFMSFLDTGALVSIRLKNQVRLIVR